MPLDLTTRQRLLALARTALEAHLAREAPPRVPPDLVVDAFGVFVTLRVNGDLRGCLGSLDCPGSIGVEIVRLAAAVATDDHRFTPLARRELGSATLDLSVLTPPEPVLDHRTIEVGRHGLIVEQGRRRGLLLPSGGNGTWLGSRHLPDAHVRQSGPRAGRLAERSGGVTVRSGRFRRGSALDARRPLVSPLGVSSFQLPVQSLVASRKAVAGLQLAILELENSTSNW